MQANPKPLLTPRRREIYYPEGDGKPVGETDVHVRELLWAVAALQRWYEDKPDVYVSGSILMYYVEGDPKQVCSPDVLVAFGRPKGLRRTYKTWVEGKSPDVVIEFTSRKTRRNDLHKKRALYAQLGVREYVLFDPTHEYLKPPLQVLRLEHGEYVAAPPTEGLIISQVLNMRLYEENAHLRFECLETGKMLEDPDDIHQARLIAERQHRFYLRRFEQEANRSHDLEEQLKQYTSARETLERQASEAEARAQEQAQERARAEDRAQEQAQERARAEARAREAEHQAQQLAAELERLRAQLASKAT